MSYTINMDTNESSLGTMVENWNGCAFPVPRLLKGHTLQLEPFNIERHAHALYDAFALDREGKLWTYMAHGPFSCFEDFLTVMRRFEVSRDPQTYAIIDVAHCRAIGIASYLRIDPHQGTIEVGNLTFSPLLARSRMATEAMYLMMKNAFDLGYRRYEWKCNALNAPSRRAAERLGFTYEGIYRQAMVVKGRNRDTAWYSILDGEWPSIRIAFERWLSPENFDPTGQQRQRLADVRRKILFMDATL